MDALLYATENITDKEATAQDIYQELVVEGSLSYASCDSWLSYITSNLAYSALLHAPASMEIAFASDPYEPYISVVCDDTSALTGILGALTSPSTGPRTVQCNGVAWVVRLCVATGKPAMCVGCIDPCNTADCTLSNPFYIYPCATSSAASDGISTASCSSFSSSLHVLSTAFEGSETPPSIVNVTIPNATVSETGAVVSFQVTRDSTAYCAQYGPTEEPSSLNSIFQRGFKASSGAAGSSEMVMVSAVLSGLRPSYAYAVYCAARTASGIASMSLPSILATRTGLHTACCETLFVEVLTEFVPRNQQFINAIAIRTDFVPAKPLAIDLSAFYPVSQSSDLVIDGLQPTSIQISNTLEQFVSLGQAATQTVGNVFIRVNVTNSNRYNVSYTGGVDSFRVLGLSEIPAPPSAVTAAFSGDGSALTVSFDGATNRGNVASATFGCAPFFLFAGVELTTCAWLDDARLSITLYPNYAISVGDTVLYVGNPNITAKCVAYATNCGAYESVAQVTLTIQQPGFSLSAAFTASSEVPSSSIKTALAALRATVGMAAATSSASKALATVTPRPVEAPVTPTVVLTVASQVPACDPLLVDFSSSYGSGNKDWASATFQVVIPGGGNASYAAELEAFLSSGAVASSSRVDAQVNIPASFLHSGVHLTLVLTLCNGLGACGEAQALVLVLPGTGATTPVVTVAGGLYRTIRVNEALLLEANMLLTPCMTSIGDLQYLWKVSLSGVTQVQLVSESKQANVFKLPSYALKVQSLYDVSLSVVNAATLKGSLTAVQVFVDPGDVHAVIVGGSVRSVRVSSSITLDASLSYDDDSSDMTGLTFLWSCRTVQPVLSMTCALTLPASLDGRTLVASAVEEHLGATAEFTVQVTDGAERSASASVEVLIIQDSTATVSILSAPLRKINTFDKLKVTASVQSLVAGFITWSINDSTVVLSSASLTDVSAAIPASSSLSTIPVNLALVPNSLPANAYLSFTLSFRAQGSDAVTDSSSVLVRTNSAPRPGLLHVTPGFGAALVDQFRFSASLWSDEDLPLFYAFGFYPPGDESLQLVQLASERTFGYSELPAGLDSTNYEVRCELQVLDSLGAGTLSPVVMVRVFQASDAIDTAVVTLNNQLVASAVAVDDVNAIQQLLSVSGTTLNDVQCSGAPDCQALGRQSCSQKSHTCGACQDGLVGEAGHANTACFATSSFPSTRARTRHLRSLQASGGCASDSDCGALQLCNTATGVCATPSKECANDCSGHGTCVFVDSTGQSGASLLSSCTITDLHCAAVCVCNSAWYGSSCAHTNATFVALQSTRERAIDRLYYLTQLQDLTTIVLESWIATLQTLSLREDELTTSAVQRLDEVVSVVLQGAATLSVPYETVQPLVGVISNSMGAMGYQSLLGLLPQERRLQSIVSSEARVRSLLGELSNVVLSDLVQGQRDFSSVQDNLRVSAAIRSYGTKVSTAVPQSSLEQYLGTNSTFTELLLTSDPMTAIKLSLVALQSLQEANDLGVNSYPLLLQLEDAATLCNESCAVSLSLANVEYLLFYPNQAASVSRQETQCPTGRDVSALLNATYTCSQPSATLLPDSQLTVRCESDFSGSIFSSCPYTDTAPVCGTVVAGEVTSLASATNASSTCTTARFSSSSTACECLLDSTAFSTVLAAGGTSSASSAGVIELAAYTTYVPYNATIFYTTTTTPSTNENEIVKALSDNRYYFIGAGLVLVGLLSFGFYWSIYKPRKDERAREEAYWSDLLDDQPDSSVRPHVAKKTPVARDGAERELSVHDIYVTKNSPGMTPDMVYATNVGRKVTPKSREKESVGGSAEEEDPLRKGRDIGEWLEARKEQESSRDSRGAADITTPRARSKEPSPEKKSPGISSRAPSPTVTADTVVDGTGTSTATENMYATVLKPKPSVLARGRDIEDWLEEAKPKSAMKRNDSYDRPKRFTGVMFDEGERGEEKEEEEEEQEEEEEEEEEEEGEDDDDDDDDDKEKEEKQEEKNKDEKEDSKDEKEDFEPCYPTKPVVSVNIACHVDLRDTNDSNDRPINHYLQISEDRTAQSELTVDDVDGMESDTELGFQERSGCGRSSGRSSRSSVDSRSSRRTSGNGSGSGSGSRFKPFGRSSLTDTKVFVDERGDASGTDLSNTNTNASNTDVDGDGEEGEGESSMEDDEEDDKEDDKEDGDDEGDDDDDDYDDDGDYDEEDSAIDDPKDMSILGMIPELRPSPRTSPPASMQAPQKTSIMQVSGPASSAPREVSNVPKGLLARRSSGLGTGSPPQARAFPLGGTVFFPPAAKAAALRATAFPPATSPLPLPVSTLPASGNRAMPSQWVSLLSASTSTQQSSAAPADASAGGGKSVWDIMQAGKEKGAGVPGWR